MNRRMAAKIRWDTIYDAIYIRAQESSSTAKTGTFRLIKFGGLTGGELFFMDVDSVGEQILIPLFQVRYARVKAP